MIFAMVGWQLVPLSLDTRRRRRHRPLSPGAIMLLTTSPLMRTYHSRSVSISTVCLVWPSISQPIFSCLVEVSKQWMVDGSTALCAGCLSGHNKNEIPSAVITLQQWVCKWYEVHGLCVIVCRLCKGNTFHAVCTSVALSYYHLGSFLQQDL